MDLLHILNYNKLILIFQNDHTIHNLGQFVEAALTEMRTLVETQSIETKARHAVMVEDLRQVGISLTEMKTNILTMTEEQSKQQMENTGGKISPVNNKINLYNPQELN